MPYYRFLSNHNINLETRNKKEHLIKGSLYAHPQTVLKKKIVQVEQVQLQMTHKHLPQEDSASSPAYFFLRTTPDPVPSPPSPEEATAVLAGCFEMGTVDCGHPLQSLSQILTHLYIPMLTIAGTQHTTPCNTNHQILYLSLTIQAPKNIFRLILYIRTYNTKHQIAYFSYTVKH